MGRYILALAIPGLAVAVVSPLRGQSVADPPTVQRAVETITEADFRAGIGVLADDSMRGRDTPSRELDRAAAWIASEFERVGLEPAGDRGSYLQRVTLRRTRLGVGSAVAATVRGTATTMRLGERIALLGGPMPPSRAAFPMLLFDGVPTDLANPFGERDVRGKAVLVLAAPTQLRNDVVNPLTAAAVERGVTAVVIVSEVPQQQWARLAPRWRASELWELAGSSQESRQTGVPLFFVQRASMEAFLSAVGVEPDRTPLLTAPTVRELEGAELALEPVWDVSPDLSVANVVGVLEGSDSSLGDEAVVFVAHMDHVGVTADGRCGAAGADSVCNGANDNASGVVGVIELAEAYASMRPRPLRTMVFLAVTAEERGLLGAYHYASHPVVPMDRTVAAINFDMLARNAPDSIQLVGMRYSSLGAIAGRVAAEHPELRMAPVVDESQHAFAFRSSDHYPFAVAGVPVLFFFSGVHQDLHGPTDAPENADCDKGARVARLAFYIGLYVANAAERPQWDPDARARIVEGPGGH